MTCPPALCPSAAVQARNAAAGGRLDGEPMFCFESAIKLFFWSCLLYEDYEGVSEGAGGCGCCRRNARMCVLVCCCILRPARADWPTLLPCLASATVASVQARRGAGGSAAVSEGELEQLMKGMALYGLQVHKVRQRALSRCLSPPAACWQHVCLNVMQCGSVRCCRRVAVRRHQVLWDADGELKVMFAWSPDTVLVAFRGSTTGEQAARAALLAHAAMQRVHMRARMDKRAA